MDDDRFRRVEETFHEAAELPPDARPDFLDRACRGDEELRREVETLLAHDTSEGHVLAGAVARAAGLLPALDAPAEIDLTGRQIGAYIVTKKIGSGGMGVVYQARDTQLERTVAIKVLPKGLIND